SFINPGSLEVLTQARVEASLAGVAGEARFQFEREGYFCADPVESRAGNLVFNRTVGLKDSWGKQA
ncbi:MAG: glutamine--tRNA ligase, partial [Perlucidibaca sp.]